VAENESRATQNALLQVDVSTFWRLGRWSLAAVAALAVAFLIGSSEAGLRRIALAVANIQGTAAAVQSRESVEIVRLSEALKKLASERDQLAARLDTIERNLDDLTGSVALNTTPPRPAEVVPPPRTEPVPMPVIVPSNVPSSPPPAAAANTSSIVVANAPANIPAASNPTSSEPQSPRIPLEQEAPVADTPLTAKIDFGADLGSAPTIEGLRALWMSAKSRHGALLDGLRPIVALRERAKLGTVELRLVVGPLPSAVQAARLCVVITATGTVCQPAVFDGQRLALR